MLYKYIVPSLLQVVKIEVSKEDILPLLVEHLVEQVKVVAVLLGGTAQEVVAVIDIESGLVNSEIDSYNIGASSCSCLGLQGEGFANIQACSQVLTLQKDLKVPQVLNYSVSLGILLQFLYSQYVVGIQVQPLEEQELYFLSTIVDIILNNVEYSSCTTYRAAQEQCFWVYSYQL